ncbi:MAG: hypothetical protein ACFCU4_06500 [Puniceicoccaceae bacterium]
MPHPKTCLLPTSLRDAAFTLVEVLLALSLLALGSYAIVASIVSSIQALNADFDTDPLRYWAERQVLQLDPDQLERGDSLTLPDDRKVTYRAKIEDGPLPDLMEFSLTLEVDGETIEFTFLRYLPNRMEPSTRIRLQEQMQGLLR